MLSFWLLRLLFFPIPVGSTLVVLVGIVVVTGTATLLIPFAT